MIKNGKISASKDSKGKWNVDKAEFYRVFPEFFNTTDGDTTDEVDATEASFSPSDIINEKDARINDLKSQLDRLEQQLAQAHKDKDAVFDTLKNSQRLIENDKTAFQKEKYKLELEITKNKKRRFIFF